MKTAWMLTTFLFLAACSGFESKAPTPASYVLTGPTLPTAPVAATVDLKVLQPGAPTALAGSRVASRWPGGRVDYFADVRWAGSLGEVVQAALVDSLADTGAVRSVMADPARLRATHLLAVEITAFEADYTAGSVPMVRVAMSFSLATSGEGRPLAHLRVRAEQRAEENTLSAVMRAMDAAFREAADEGLRAMLGQLPGAAASVN
ncbi:MAG: ABC-type transport auxiliary lipoprotein family protein [Steroidobacteraceae bacterium]